MKKKIWITSILATLCITAAVGGVALAKQEPIVTYAAEWQVGEIEKSYLYGASFEVPDAEVVINGKTVKAAATVTYPDGLTTTADNVQLNQAGVYTVTYRAVVDGTHYVEHKEFSVVNRSYLVQDEKSSATYGKYTQYDANSEGLLVRLAPDDTLTFSQLIDFDELKPTDKIIEFFITPDARGAYDFKRLIITLTDPTDASKYLRYEVSRYTAEDRGVNTSYVTAGGDGQNQVGCENGNYRVNALGSPIQFTFIAGMHKNNGWTGEIVERIPDLDKCSITYNHETMEAQVLGKHIGNLNDIEHFGSVWGGLPSGKAILTVHAEEYATATANFCITRVFGVDLKQESFMEGDAPEITVSMAEDEMPQGQVGYGYPIPEATAFDYYSGVCDVKYSVYRDYAGKQPVSVGVVDNVFTPTVAGWHTIVYTATDALGNEETVERNVYVSSDLGDIDITLPQEPVTEARLGEWVPVALATYTGDCGIADMKITVTNGNETKEITDGFLPEIAGEWKVTYTVTDYIGRSATASYTVNATAHDDYILLDDVVLPQIYVSDSEYKLPEIYAKSYSTGKAEEVLCDVVVTDKNGAKTYKAGETFVPSVEENGDKVTVSYQYNGEELATKEVPAVLVMGTGKIIAQNYLYGEDVTTALKDENDEFYKNGVAVFAKEDSEVCGWTFATPQLIDNFNVLFQGIEGRANFNGLKLTLTDSLNAKEEICVTLTVKKEVTTMTVGEMSAEVSGVSLTGSDQYTISYSEGKFTVGSISLTADKTTSGEAFTGFSSNLAYVKVEMLKAKKDAGYLVLAVCGANLSRRNLDTFAPNFKILGDFGGNQSLNTVYEIYPAIANDVFAPNTALSLTVLAPDGSVVTDNNGLKLENVATNQSYFITLSQYGQYQAVYTVEEEDWVVKNALLLQESVFVIDEAAPQLKFINATQTTAKVGDVIVIPDFVFQDNITANENIRVVRGVFNPYGRLSYFKENENAIKCSYAGEYTFIVLVMDEFGNAVSVQHTVTVTE